MKNYWKQLSWKKKVLAGRAGLVLTLWIVYSFSISGTLELRRNFLELEQKAGNSEGLSAQVEALKAELVRCNSLTEKNGEFLSHEELLDRVTLYCSGRSLKIREFPSPVSYHSQEWNVITHPVTIEGNYAGIIRLLEYLRSGISANVVSVHFRTETDKRTKEKKLLATIYIQCIENMSS